MTSDEPIVADRGGRNRCCPHWEAPKRSRHERLKRDKERGHGNKTASLSRKAALPTNATRKSWQHREYHDETHCATTIIVAVASSPQLLYLETNRRPFLDRKTRADLANTCPWSPTTQSSGSTKTKTSSKNKRSRRDTWNAHHARDTRSTNSASELASSVRDTVLTKQSKRKGWQQQIPSWWIPHKKMNVGCDVVSLSLSRKSSPTKRSEKKIGQWSWLGWCVQRCYLANFETASDADLKNGIQVEKTRATC